MKITLGTLLHGLRSLLRWRIRYTTSGRRKYLVVYKQRQYKHLPGWAQAMDDLYSQYEYGGSYNLEQLVDDRGIFERLASGEKNLKSGVYFDIR